MTQKIGVLILMAFAVCQNRTALGDGLAPGLHKGLSALDPLIKYDLYLPKSYTATSSLPVAFIVQGLSSDSSEWAKKRMTAWAEQNNAAVFLMVSGPPSKALHDKIIKDRDYIARVDLATLNKIPGLDPHVRVATVVNGYSADMSASVEIALMFPGSIAGIIHDQWMNEPRPDYRPAGYLALVELHAIRAAWARTPLGPESFYPFEAGEKYVRGQTHFQYDPLLRRGEGPYTMLDWSGAEKVDLDVVDDGLEFLIDSVLLTHPKVTAARRQAAASAIADRLKQAKAETNPLLRYRTFDVISRLAALKGPVHKEAVEAWQAATIEIIEPQPDDLARYELIESLLADPRMKGAAQIKMLKAKLDALKADPKCKNEVLAHACVQDIMWQQWAALQGSLQRQRAGFLKPGTHIIPQARWMDAPEILKLFNEVIKRYPNTFGAKEAQMKINEIHKHGP